MEDVFKKKLKNKMLLLEGGCEIRIIETNKAKVLDE